MSCRAICILFCVNLDEMKIYVTYQNGSYNFPILGADEYPKAQSVSDNATTITLQAEKLSDRPTIKTTTQKTKRPLELEQIEKELSERGIQA